MDADAGKDVCLCQDYLKCGMDLKIIQYAILSVEHLLV
jgi:hypothetical protein